MRKSLPTTINLHVLEEMKEYKFLFSQYEQGIIAGMLLMLDAEENEVPLKTVEQMLEKYCSWLRTCQIREFRQQAFHAAKMLFPKGTAKTLFEYADNQVEREYGKDAQLNRHIKQA